MSKTEQATRTRHQVLAGVFRVWYGLTHFVGLDLDNRMHVPTIP